MEPLLCNLFFLPEGFMLTTQLLRVSSSEWGRPQGGAQKLCPAAVGLSGR